VLDVGFDDVRLFLHLLAATVWVGGQLTLAALVPVLVRVHDEAPRAVAVQFGRIAWPAFAVLVVTGIWNIVAVGDAGDEYRRTLELKLAVVVLSGVAAYLHARARTRRGLALWGALTGLSALLALFLGVLLS